MDVWERRVEDGPIVQPKTRQGKVRRQNRRRRCVGHGHRSGNDGSINPSKQHPRQLQHPNIVSSPPKDPKQLIRLLDLAPKLSTRDGFVDEYFVRLKHHETRANAYWSVEHDHMSIFGRTRYNGHEVFASVLSRWNNKRRSDL